MRLIPFEDQYPHVPKTLRQKVSEKQAGIRKAQMKAASKRSEARGDMAMYFVAPLFFFLTFLVYLFVWYIVPPAWW